MHAEYFTMNLNNDLSLHDAKFWFILIMLYWASRYTTVSTSSLRICHHQMVTQIVISFSSHWILFYTHGWIQNHHTRELNEHEGYFCSPRLPIQVVFCPQKYFRWTALDIHRLCGQSSWLQIQRSQAWFLAIPYFLRSSRSGMVSTQPREYNWGATWMEK
jgi:hypothetical protein